MRQGFSNMDQNSVTAKRFLALIWKSLRKFLKTDRGRTERDSHALTCRWHPKQRTEQLRSQLTHCEGVWHHSLFTPLIHYIFTLQIVVCRFAEIFSLYLYFFECTKYILNFELTMSEFLLAHLSPRVQIILDYSQAVSGLLVDAG